MRPALFFQHDWIAFNVSKLRGRHGDITLRSTNGQPPLSYLHGLVEGAASISDDGWDRLSDKTRLVSCVAEAARAEFRVVEQERLMETLLRMTESGAQRAAR